MSKIALPLFFLFPLQSEKEPMYPKTRTESVVETLHGTSVADPYRWLENGEAKEVQEWTEKQNQFTRKHLDAVRGRDAIAARLDELLKIGTISAPAVAKGRYFYERREGTQNHAILYWRQGLHGEDKVLLDPNTLSKDGTTAMDWWNVSDDGRLLVYGLSESGSERSVLSIRDVDTGRDLPDKIEHTRACTIAWQPDGKAFYYTRYPAPGSVPKGEENYHRHVFYHVIGTDPAKDPEIFGKGRDAQDWPSVQISPDGRWLLVTESQGWSKSEVYLKDLKAGSDFVPVVEKIDALYGVDVQNDRLYITTNEGAPNYRVFSADPEKPGRANWKEIIPESKDVLQGAGVVAHKLAANYLVKVTSRLRLYELDGRFIQEVPLPALGTTGGIGGEWDGDEGFFSFSSFSYAPSVYRFDYKTGKTELWDRVHADINPEAFETRQVFFESKDGTSVPMFVVHKKGLPMDGKSPAVLNAYGGFNVSLTPGFTRNYYLFLEKGGVVAVANLRGGGEFGESWHQSGMLDKKQNVFDDCAAAAEWLIKSKLTSASKLAIWGGSNGGLLVGAMVTQRPDLFRAALCDVPLLDMVRYHKFLIAKLWIPEYGSADDPAQFKTLYAYSPYHHVKDGAAYPAMLITAAESDTRVDPMHARKFAARLQAASSGANPVLLRIETKAGHGAGKPRSKTLDELVDAWSFLFWQLEVSP
jgi:prolyl oligopeptidase